MFSPHQENPPKKNIKNCYKTAKQSQLPILVSSVMSTWATLYISLLGKKKILKKAQEQRNLFLRKAIEISPVKLLSSILQWKSLPV